MSFFSDGGLPNAIDAASSYCFMNADFCSLKRANVSRVAWVKSSDDPRLLGVWLESVVSQPSSKSCAVSFNDGDPSPEFFRAPHILLDRSLASLPMWSTARRSACSRFFSSFVVVVSFALSNRPFVLPFFPFWGNFVRPLVLCFWEWFPFVLPLSIPCSGTFSSSFVGALSPNCSLHLYFFLSINKFYVLCSNSLPKCAQLLIENGQTGQFIGRQGSSENLQINWSNQNIIAF